MRVLFKRRAHVGREQAPVRVETIRRGGVEFAHQREDLPDVALHVLYRNIEALVACALLELGPDLVRLGDLRDREVAVNLGLHVIDAGEFGEALGPALHRRSEEHTSELQSLMRISYAVFCLKQKNKQNEMPYQI